jgi:hypothetical protein
MMTGIQLSGTSQFRTIQICTRLVQVSFDHCIYYSDATSINETHFKFREYNSNTIIGYSQI